IHLRGCHHSLTATFEDSVRVAGIHPPGGVVGVRHHVEPPTPIFTSARLSDDGSKLCWDILLRRLRFRRERDAVIPFYGDVFLTGAATGYDEYQQCSGHHPSSHRVASSSTLGGRRRCQGLDVRSYRVIRMENDRRPTDDWNESI